VTPEFWRGRRVFVTGHTGFKGAWLCLWLQRLGAEVHGYALPPPTEPSLYRLAGLAATTPGVEADVRDAAALCAALRAARPEIVLHMAAQSVVLDAHADPVGTFSTNVMGTVNLLQAVREAASGAAGPRAVVNVTTDKVYDDPGALHPCREHDRLGGDEPYAASKACAELAGQAFARSWFGEGSGVALASARAGNVVGGGDWTPHQLVPAVVQAMTRRQPVALRHPTAVRPWQHVLDCLHGYLTLAQALAQQPAQARGAWNFGPAVHESLTVAQVAQRLATHWGVDPAWVPTPAPPVAETHALRLDSTRAAQSLGWRARLEAAEALDWTAQWYRRVQAGAAPRAVCLAQIEAFEQRLWPQAVAA
jgi:CDP-glucose 4,6-dehydratase